MTDGTVPESRAPEIVESWRNSTQRRAAVEVGVAFQAKLSNVASGEHSRVGGPVRLVTGGATFEPYRRVLVGERTTLIGVALQAPRFPADHLADVLRQERTMGIVAVSTSHRLVGLLLLGQEVGVGPLELSAHIHVAGSALFVDPHRARRRGGRSMHRMATGARHLVASMSAHDTADMAGLVGMAL